MKRVHFAIGAVGVAGVAPALGLITAANATTVTTHAQDAGKTVSLAPLVSCGSNHIASKDSTNGHLHAVMTYSGLCVHSQWASLNRAQTGLTERTRFYSGNGHLERTTWQAGKIYNSIPLTRFTSTPNSYADTVCIALVANSNHANVKYGPVCMDPT